MAAPLVPARLGGTLSGSPDRHLRRPGAGQRPIRQGHPAFPQALGPKHCEQGFVEAAKKLLDKRILEDPDECGLA